MKEYYPLFQTLCLNDDEHYALDLSNLPDRLTLNRECALVTDRALTGSVVYRNPDENIPVHEVRGTLTPKGDFLIMFPLGEHYGSQSKKVNCMLSLRSADHCRTWSEPEVALNIDYNQHGFIPLIPKGTHRIYNFGTQPIWNHLYTWKNGLGENAPIGYFYSDDDGHTWEGPHLIAPVEDESFTGMSVTRMCETDRGTWLLGAHNAYWHENQTPNLQTYQYILRSEDRGKTWHILPGARDEGFQCIEYKRMDEGRVISLGGEDVLLLLRTPEGHIWRSISHDDGRTWETPRPTSLIHPDAPPMVFLLSDQKTLAVFHHNRFHDFQYSGLSSKPEVMKDRNEIWVSFSTDQGLTWSEPRFLFANVAQIGGDDNFSKYQCSYLDMVEEGTTVHLFVPHLWHNILHLQIEEEDLKRAPLRSELF